MSDLEKALLKDVLHLLVDKELPVLLAALEAKIPAAYQVIAGAIVAELQPEMLKLIDAKIDAI